eukprot:TRINITY_DN15720_c0_g1_i1.p1 TRINITY_DN15720_c0_g1~~TRINITY_DN15720_c0_g1_i1.p1  ORF type:complete len:257 (-),score=6.36 TRINITY_DN15720_c0_g1_i1:551-1321(-)
MARMGFQYVLLSTVVCILVGLFVLSIQASGEGCYWTAQCMNRYIGECGKGDVVVDYSDDCKGRCPKPAYEECLVFHTHFQCCAQDAAVASQTCAWCSKKLELVDHWVCCSDCSEPTVTSSSGSAVTGYCKTGAQFSIQSILPEVVQWMTGDWHSCSCTGGHAIRQRDVLCVLTSDTHQSTVADARCSQWAAPVGVESCVDHPCNGRKGMPLWAILLISLMSVTAIAGCVFGGYVLYKRYYGDKNQGFVYVMLEGYS